MPRKVLKKDSSKLSQREIVKKSANPAFSLELAKVSFNYNNNTQVFEDHNLLLEIDTKQKNKLYGIIGPSGTGKTTLISVLGGQLKPDSGQVLINGIDIYEVDDYKRRELIALQIQSSTSLRGKLKYNLTFGLPTKGIGEEDGNLTSKNTSVYSDEYLIKILQNVGLWSLFKDKDGLDTLIGEGGINLSGGQRQRLNFASLFLRAKFFKPKLILIDEPTSSLDEISEKAITKMILEMGKQALTLVVAHRLKTLDDALGLLDSSLFLKQKELNFLTKTELKKVSKYYQDLQAGKAILDEN